MDFVSEIASLQSVFAIPAMIAIGIGAGLAQGSLAGGLLIAVAAVAFGAALSKWVSSSIGSLLRKRRTRGETLLAFIGAGAGLAGALFAQIAPIIFRHSEYVTALRWTPPGIIAIALTDGLRPGGTVIFAVALAILTGYTVVLIAVTYWLARRAVLGGGRKKGRQRLKEVGDETYTGWELPLVSPELSAMIEKELRYSCS